jgi:hypothetical protein
MWRSSAAREKFPVEASAKKSSSQIKFIADAFAAWDKAESALASRVRWAHDESS